MNNLKQLLMVSAMLMSTSFTISHAKAMPDARAFGERWQPQAAPIGEQAQIIYYRNDDPVSQQAALVTLNGELHAALLPGMYTRICIAPGSYTLGGWLDAPGALNASHSGFQATLKAGKTYFVRVSEQADSRPQPVRRVEAERELSTLRMQQHVLSRSSAIVECRYTSSSQVTQASH